MLYRLKNCISTLLALVVCLAVGACLYARDRVALRGLQGERTFYLQSASSQSLIKQTLSFKDLPCLTGESVTFTLQEEKEEALREILRLYEAEILFTEEACGVVSYYASAKKLGKGIDLYGYAVNLHIAIEGTRCAVGTPIIFGGF